MTIDDINHAGIIFVSHFRAEIATGVKFLYCPVGKIVSWLPDDYDNKWCHYCKRSFDEILDNQQD